MNAMWILLNFHWSILWLTILFNCHNHLMAQGFPSSLATSPISSSYSSNNNNNLNINNNNNYINNNNNNYRDLDICNHWNGRRHFLELGERGDLHARNVTISAFRSNLFSPPLINANGSASDGSTLNRNLQGDIWYQCNLELVTCADCVIRITFTHVNFSRTCQRVGKSSLCPCEHIQFSEPPYDTTISGQEFCGEAKVLRSKTRTLLLKFFYRATNSHVFSLQYFSERNVKIVSGSTTSHRQDSKLPQEVIATPYFPMAYPRDYGIEHILTCEAEACQVRLDFTDFQLGLTSTLEIFDSNGQMLDSYTGEHFRPPIIVSSGKSLLLQFRGNGATGAGFRAEVSFISPKQLKDEHLQPYTDCGGMVSGPGGAITMMNMIDNTSDVRLYDCIWIIKPGNNYMMMKTHISLRVEEFYGMASRSDLTIRQGTTSDALEIENVVWPNNGMSKESHIVPIFNGYYIRLRGVFGMSSKLAIVYSAFNYLNCYIGSEFLCGNNHCISIRLHCDGFDHCGDASDEPETCEEDWAHLHNDRRWYSHKPNYYFPKIEQYPDLKTATGIFIISTLGIFTVLSGWMVILYRMGVRARQQRELQSHLQTISELLDRQDEAMPVDEPPSYEAPPDYEEIIKVGMEEDMRETQQTQQRQRRRRRHNREHEDRSCSHSAAQQTTANVPIHSGVGATPDDASKQQDLANRVQLATVLCDATKSFGASTSQCCHHKPSMGLPKGPLSFSIGCELSTTEQQSQHYAAPSSCGTPSQLDECIDNFRDESLNISFTLALPSDSLQSPLYTLSPQETDVILTASSKLALSKDCFTEQTLLKRSWILVNNGGINSYKLQRLRHTYSSPEAFPITDASLLTDILSYGTNLPYDRSCLSSKDSNFGSELSKDPSIESPTLADVMPPEDGKANDEDDNENDGKISCFGHLNKPFRVVSDKFKEQRSKSFDNNNEMTNDCCADNQIHRSSSANLLLSSSEFPSPTYTSNYFGCEQKGYLI